MSFTIMWKTTLASSLHDTFGLWNGGGLKVKKMATSTCANREEERRRKRRNRSASNKYESV